MKNERCFKENLIKKITKMFIFPLFTLIGLTFIMGFYYERNIYVKLNDVTVELGDKLPEEIRSYMDLLPIDSNLAMESNILLDDDGNSMMIGEYSYYLVYNNNNYKFSQMTNVKSKIIVVDTTEPVISVNDDIKIKYGSKIKTSDIAVCYDLSSCNIYIEDEIDTNKSGSYEVSIKAIDGGGNVSYAKANVVVLEKPKPVVYNYNPYGNLTYKAMNDSNNNKNSLLSEEEKENLRIQIVNFAKQFIGNPYVYGGTSLTNGTDCSGFTMSVYANFGYALPRVASHQAYVGKVVSVNELLPGDIVVYTYGHVGIYVGNGMMVHAGTSKTGITLQPMFDGYRVYRRIIF